MSIPSRLKTIDYPTVNRGGVVDRMQEIQRRRAKRATNKRLCASYAQLTFDAIRELMEEADPEVRIVLPGLGTLEVAIQQAHTTARVPHSNQKVYIPPRQKSFFRSAGRLAKVLKRPLYEKGFTWAD